MFSSAQGINLKVPVEITNDVIEVCKTWSNNTSQSEPNGSAQVTHTFALRSFAFFFFLWLKLPQQHSPSEVCQNQCS